MTAQTITPTTERTKRALGTDLSGVTTIDDALKAADLDWGIKILGADDITITTKDAEGVASTIPSRIPGMRLVTRDDNHTVLGVVGGRYNAVDNHAVFGIGEHILNQGGVLKRAGSLDHGRKAFMDFDLPGSSVEVGGIDLVTFGVRIEASHDGTGRVEAGLVGTRLVCTNGMVAKIKGLSHRFTIRHTASALSRLSDAQSILQGAVSYSKGFAAITDTMLDTKFTAKEFGQYIDRLFPKPEEDEKRSLALWKTRRDELVALFNFAETNDLGRNSAWSAYNSVTEYLDWVAPVRGSSLVDGEDIRPRRQFENTSQKTRDEAFSLLTV